MTTLLHIDASARQTRSISRELSNKFITTWKEQRPEDEVIRRDVGLNPPPATTEAWIASVFTSPVERTPEQVAEVALSDQLIDELDRADIIVLGAPMYNYGMPTALKAWVDQVVRVGKTFSFDLSRGDYPLEPIMSGKTLVLLSSCGEFGFQPGGIRETMNHFDTHINTIKHYLGVEVMHHIYAEYQEFGDDRHDNSVKEAHAAAVKLTHTLIAK
ncbi:MAG: FMN-dependent NADH-azoreductase [Cellvibrionaceae bacterium]